MITSNHSKKKYKNNGLVNGARGYIDSIQPSKENSDVAKIIWALDWPVQGKIWRKSIS